MASPSPSKGGLRSRMGTMLRRTSSVFSKDKEGSRSSSPVPGSSRRSLGSSRRSSASQESLRKLDTKAQPPAAAPEHHQPSPIAESPAREAASLTAEPTAPAAAHGPSPLANAIAAESTQSVGAASSVGQPILTDGAGPGGFTEEPEGMSTLGSHDGHAPSHHEAQPAEPAAEAPKEPEPVSAPAPEPARQDASTSPIQAAVPETPAPAPALEVPAPQPQVITPETSPGYFEIPVPAVTQPGPALSSTSMDDDINEANIVIGQAPQKQVEVTRPSSPAAGADNATDAWKAAANANSPLAQEEGQAKAPASYGDPFSDPDAHDYEVVEPAGMPIPEHENGNGYHVDATSPVQMPVPQSAAPPTETQPLLAGGTASLYGEPSFAQHEWIRYTLPDPGSTAYYVHPGRAITTDIDLTLPENLAAVQAFLTSTHRQRDGAEMWLVRKEEQGSDARKHDKHDKRRSSDHGFKLLWVDHGRRRCLMQESYSRGDKDAEARYWAFMEAHPAHTTLPTNARNEAIEALMWIYSDNVIPEQPGTRASAPFSRGECQSILRVLRDQTHEEFGDSIIQIRLIARIMRRVAQWRAHGGAGIPQHSSVADVAISMVSALCLGLPYLFLANDRSHAVNALRDLEGSFSHVVSLSPAVYLAGACTCIMGAVVLSASVTLLSLPGLDSVARVAGFVAALVSAFSMVSAVVALVRFQSDLTTVSLGEGMIVLSRRHVLMSVPVALLIYSVIALVVALVVYAFRGAVVNPSMHIERHFGSYTTWSTLAVLGGLLGMLTMSFMSLRRY
ncbi:hypothetical protein FB107DRAFT_293842 [Schizophyllum commune]